MWFYKRFFISIIACGVLFGCTFFLRLQLNDHLHQVPPPEFLPNVARYRTSRVCSARALVLVNSSPYKAQRRQLIRETWAHPSVTQSLDVSVAFAVGVADKPDVQRSLDWEAEIYGDVFQDSVPEMGSAAAARSAPKIMRLLKTARSACAPAPEFIMKTEDDVFLNDYALAELLESLQTYASSNTIWCLEWNRKLDQWARNTTWIVLRTQSREVEHHPVYCIANSYLMTNRALDALIRRHDLQSSDTLLPEDAYVTGMLAKEARLTLSLLGERFMFHDQNEVDVGKVFLAHLGNRVENDTQKLWRNLMREKLDYGSRRAEVGL